jgi:hypothetical protein
VTPTCPFVNLPETRRSRFGEELNAEKMKKVVWLRPEAVAQIEFLEWTEADRVRSSKVRWAPGGQECGKPAVEAEKMDNPVRKY